MTNGSGSAWSDTIRRGFVGFLAIFLGVSLSFVAEDWRESLGEAREFRAVLEGIRADLSEDLSTIRWHVRADSAAAAAALWIHQNWEAPRLSPDSLTRVLPALVVAGPYSPVHAGADARAQEDQRRRPADDGASLEPAGQRQRAAQPRIGLRRPTP